MIEGRVTVRAAASERWRAAILAGAGLAALAVRVPGWGAVGVVAGVGAVGLLAPLPRRDRPAGPGRWAVAVAVGAVPMAIVAAAAAFPVLVVAPVSIGAGVLAAVAEEAFFRRFLYGWLAGRGPALAIAATAAAFAVVHLPLYGPDALALDLAAGLLLGWQRWAAGTWTAPAATHALANLLAYV